MKRCICGQLIDDTKEECSECARPSSCTVDSLVGFPIPTSYEEYLMLTDEQKFRLYEITKKPNDQVERTQKADKGEN